MNLDLLFEIGSEELPAAYLPAALEQLKSDAAKSLQDAHVAFGAVETYGTSRRLIVLVKQLNAVQKNPAEELRGPSKQVAFDAAGKPTEALKGFLRSRGGELSQTTLVSTDKGQYIYLRKPAREVPTVSILPPLLEPLISRLRFPKTMRWDAGGARFARPIRWLLALYGATSIRVKFGALASGRTTQVGGPVRPTSVAINNPSRYFAVLKQRGIQWDQAGRRAVIERFVAAHAKSHQGVPAPEMLTHGLLDEVTFLVERPTPLYGRFDEKYLELPREVLLASMAKHQRVFALEDRRGNLLPAFVAILDGKPTKMDRVRNVHEHILNARLADSLLFWEEDRKQPLSKRDVSGVTFHEKLGSMADKTKRLEHLSAVLADGWQLSSSERTQLQTACRLAKSDLVATMVKEFPTLQGAMGKYYAKASGESDAVAEALEEQYLPLANKQPKTLLGRALAVLDKYDTLAGYFSIGIEPTGDQDPFGLRRAAQGIIEVGWAIHKPLPLGALFARWSQSNRAAKPETQRRINRYLLERLYTFEWPKPAPTRDLIDAVLSSPCDDPIDAMDRIRHLQRLDGDQTLLKAAKVIERTSNILRGANTQPEPRVEQQRLQEPLEQQLWERYTAREGNFKQLVQQKSYGEATKLYSEAFYDVLHEFFATVMVNVQDPAIQQNRLALMRIINALYTDRIADLSKLAILQQGVVEAP